MKISAFPGLATRQEYYHYKQKSTILNAKYKLRNTIIICECSVNIRVSIKWVPTLDAIVLYLR